MDELIKLKDLLPNRAEIANLVQSEAEAEYILQLATESMSKIGAEELHHWEASADEARYLVECLVDKCWERIHTGHFSAVPVQTRKIYAVANFFKIFYLLFESQPTLSQAEKCSALLDEAQLLGCTQDLYANSDILMRELTKLLDNFLSDCTDFELPILEPLKRQQLRCDIPQIECPAVDYFRQHFFEPQEPALLLQTVRHWPALKKWHDLNYILKVAGNRTVPIEIGSNYVNEEWSQQLVKIRDFLRRQFAKPTPSDDGGHSQTTEIEYLAQHELFDQIPALKSDIRIPEYCTLSSAQDSGRSDILPLVDIKAWLGPCGTISPMHYDPKHNLLCQVFGQKRIILAAPADTPNLYAHESEFLGNTSQIDAAHLDCVRFPRAAHVRFYELTLQQGDCLYMPPKWWHYVQAESASFSVSFWWE